MCICCYANCHDLHLLILSIIGLLHAKDVNQEVYVTCLIIILSPKSNQTDPCHRSLDTEDVEQVVQLRTRGDGSLCSLRKENLTSCKDPETERARHVFVLQGGSEVGGEWRPVTRLPFTADKWCLTAVVLYNYLYVIGGYRQRAKRGWEFQMASFRFNPLTLTWAATAPLIKVRLLADLIKGPRHSHPEAAAGQVFHTWASSDVIFTSP